jgi:murein DD-endopeptidase MepM/ murein hydrolase activator NlpD
VERPGAASALLPPPSTSNPLPPDTQAPRPLASPGLGAYQEITDSTIIEAPAAPVTMAPAPAASITRAPVPAEPTPAARFAAPVPGPVMIPYNRAVGASQNDGVDFAAAPGEPVRAAGDGTVALISPSLGTWGSIVLIRHGTEFMTVYGRLGATRVTKGQEVRRGEQIGVVATPPEGERALMHFEVRRGAFSEDPESFF